MILKLLRAIKIRLIQKHFSINSVYGKNTRFDSSASCSNQTGSKENILIGEHCWIRGLLSVHGSGKLVIGDRTYVGGATRIGTFEEITIGNDVIIANEVHIYDNNNHPVQPIKRLEMTKAMDYESSLWGWNDNVEKSPIRIGDNVWIGERTTILKGVTIGRGSVIACNSVVTHDVPEYCIAAGNPARIVKKLEGIQTE